VCREEREGEVIVAWDIEDCAVSQTVGAIQTREGSGIAYEQRWKH
jgi:hypothetical protein